METPVSQESTTQTPKYASFWRRVAASTFDGLVVLLVSWGINLSLGKSSSSLLLILATALYSILFWVKYNGQTPGKNLMHIKIVQTTNEPLDYVVAVIRYISQFVSMITLNIGYLWMLIDKRRQTFHDKLAKTIVIESDEVKPNGFLLFIGVFLPVLLYSLILLAVVAAIVVFSSSKYSKLTSLLFSSEGTKTITSAFQCQSSCDGNSTYQKCMETCMNDRISPEQKARLQKKLVESGAFEEDEIPLEKDWNKDMKPEAKKLFESQNKLLDQVNALPYDPAKEAAYISQLTALTDQRIDLLKKATVVDPGNALLWNWLANAYTWRSSGTVADGISAAKKSIELDPKNGDYIADLGYLYYLDGKYEDAIIELKKGIKLYPNNGHAYIYLGDSYAALNITEEAVKNYNEAIKILSKFNETNEYDKTILEIQKKIAALK